VTGGIIRIGDAMVFEMPYEVANSLLANVTRLSALKRWGMDVAKRRGAKWAKVALARKIDVIGWKHETGDNDNLERHASRSLRRCLRARSRGACRRPRAQIAREAESSGLTPAHYGTVSNAGLWIRRARFIVDALVIRSHPGRCQAETPLIAQFKFAEPAL
jgi:hypothetical protein